VDLRDYLDILRTRWKLITVTTLLGVIAAALASMLATPLYTATTKSFVSVNGGGTQTDVATAVQGSLFAQDRVKSYVDVVTADEVMGAVIDELGLDVSTSELASQISVNNPLDTVLLEISATDPNPQQAQAIANATAEALQNQVDQLEQPVGGGDSLVRISVTEPAAVPGSPSSPRTKINLALGFLVGLAVGVGAAVLLETLDTRIKSIDTLAKYFDQPLLGVIGFDPEAAKAPLLSDIPSQSKRAESFRQVRTNLQFVDIDHRPKSIVVASAVPREGKSTTAINLSITIAQTGQPVFLIEGDLRRPKVADYLGIEGMAGLTDVLVGRATVDEVLQPWGPTGNFWVMAAGPLPPNPSELLGSQAMADLIRHLEKRATLIIDVPPLLPVTDAAVLTRLSGGAILVVRCDKTRREQVRTAEQSIESVGGKILGLVMNMAPPRGPDSHRYGYGYQYDYSSVGNRGSFEDHAPVIPAGLGGLPGVNGSSTPTFPVGPVAKEAKEAKDAKDAKTDGLEVVVKEGPAQTSREPAAEPTPRPGANAKVDVTEPVPSDDKGEGASTKLSPPLAAETPAAEKVIGSVGGVPLATALEQYGHRPPHVDLLPDDTASGARFGLDDEEPLAEVGEVPVGEGPAAPKPWTPPPPRAALDPLTAPYEQLQPSAPEHPQDTDT
jgi:capsular exopolysaccharide synthesis family protein